MNLQPDFFFVSSVVTSDGTVQSAQKNQSEHAEFALVEKLCFDFVLKLTNFKIIRDNANIQNF